MAVLLVFIRNLVSAGGRGAPTSSRTSTEPSKVCLLREYPSTAPMSPASGRLRAVSLSLIGHLNCGGTWCAGNAKFNCSAHYQGKQFGGVGSMSGGVNGSGTIGSY